MASECALCNNTYEFKDGSWTCLSPFIGAKAKVCQQCTTELTMAWAKEIRRRNMPTNTPTPTSPPAGAGTAYVEQQQAVA